MLSHTGHPRMTLALVSDGEKVELVIIPVVIQAVMMVRLGSPPTHPTDTHWAHSHTLSGCLCIFRAGRLKRSDVNETSAHAHR